MEIMKITSQFVKIIYLYIENEKNMKIKLSI